MPKYINWRNFWIFWLSGLAVFALLIISGAQLNTPVAPNGILDHQAAATAERVNEIQQSWKEAGVFHLAKWGMIGDLTFIALYSIGGIMGSRLIWQYGQSPSLKKLALAGLLSYTVFGLSDNIETILQLVQLLSDQGSDMLAGAAAIARPIKIVSFIAGTLIMVITLIWFRGERRA